MNSVLLDTSFLITFADPSRENHEVAHRFFREFLRQKIPMYLSSIVISEFQVKQAYTDLPLSNFIVIPFNVDHASCCGDLVANNPRDKGDDRIKVKDDFKLIAQCTVEQISHLITEDNSTLVKYVRRAKGKYSQELNPILLKEGFDDAYFNNGQKSFDSD